MLKTNTIKMPVEHFISTCVSFTRSDLNLNSNVTPLTLKRFFHSFPFSLCRQGLVLSLAPSVWLMGAFGQKAIGLVTAVTVGLLIQGD